MNRVGCVFGYCLCARVARVNWSKPVRSLQRHTSTIMKCFAFAALTLSQSPASQAQVASEQARTGWYQSAPRFALLMEDGSIRVGALEEIGSGDVRIRVEDDLGTPNRSSVIALETVIAVLPFDINASSGDGFGAFPEAGVASVVLPADARAASESGKQGVIELVDGQRLIGRLDMSAPAAEDMVNWSTPTGGRVAVPIDRVSRIVDAAAMERVIPIPDSAGDEDALLLLNGDELTGYVLSLAPTASIETSTGVIELPSDRVAGAVLANQRVAPTGTVVALVDGSVMHAGSVITEVDEIVVASQDGWSLRAGVHDIRGFVPSADRFIPLSSIEPVGVEPLGERLFVDPPTHRRHPSDIAFGSGSTLGLSDVVLSGPMRVRYRVPEGATVFAATVSHLHRNTWADGKLAVRADGITWAEIDLSELTSGAVVRVDVRDAIELSLELLPGPLGGVRSGAVLYRPVIIAE